ncbi:hypothetical protein tb265_06800 [Gemmatimonadetes bacterium T265]|nr:hypothetical protein tb265_06800 [Gemmatimonadetes bacterium T265]
MSVRVSVRGAVGARPVVSLGSVRPANSRRGARATHRQPTEVTAGRAGVFGGPLAAFLGGAVAERFVRVEHRGMLVVGENVGTLLDQLAAYRPPTADTWICPARG